jgi:hypothetical protein
MHLRDSHFRLSMLCPRPALKDSRRGQKERKPLSSAQVNRCLRPLLYSLHVAPKLMQHRSTMQSES